MDTQSGSSNQRSLMKLVFWLGLASVIIVLLGVIAGWLIPAIGMADFLPLAMLSGLASVVIWLSMRTRRRTASPQDQRMGRAGFILGCFGLGISVLMRLLIFIFFLPWLNA